MAAFPPVNRNLQLVLPQGLRNQLHNHLFCGDGDEHGAVLTAGIATNASGTRLLARELHIAKDGIDYVPGKRGYRMLKAGFIADKIEQCRQQGLVYLAIHNHGGRDFVEFSSDDYRSHERGYPALLDISGNPVGALVFAENAIAGDVWFADGTRKKLSCASVVGASLSYLTPAPVARNSRHSHMYDRQARVFGDRGQDILGSTKVGIIGAGGAGSLLAEYLGRLGVGSFVVADPDRASISNLPRLIAAHRRDAGMPSILESYPAWLQKILIRSAKPKVFMAKRNILRANPAAKVDAVFGDFLEAEIANKFLDCDYLFLAADTMRARLLFNAIVHQYLIPGVQVGAKVRVDATSGEILDAYSVVRPVTPETGCLLCNKLINSAKLQEESISAEERKAQRYVDEPEIVAPSVVTMNAVATAHAANDFMFYITGLQDADVEHNFLRVQGSGRRVMFDATRKSPTCRECGTAPKSRLALGSARRLPTIQRNLP